MRPRLAALGALVLASLVVAPAAASLPVLPGAPDGPVALPCGTLPPVCGALFLLCSMLPPEVASLLCPEPPPPGAVDIVGESFCTPQTCRYEPASLTVQVGATVTWTNTAAATAHTATSNDGLFGSGSLQPGETYSFLFIDTGTFVYHCAVHGDLMAEGTIVVEA